MSERADTIARKDLKEATLGGVKWVAAARGGAEVLALLSSIALARLIAPADFGRVAVTLILLEVALALASHGVGAPLIQRENVTRGNLRVAQTMALVIGLLLSGAVYAGAPLVVPGLFGEESVALFQMMAPVFVIAGPGAVAHAVLVRRMDFKTVSVVQLVGMVAGLAVVLGLALAGLGAEALIIGRLAGIGVATVLQVAAARLPLPSLRGEDAGEIARFGAHASSSAVLWAVHRNIDFAIVAAKLGATQAGLYFRAFNLAVEYQSKLTNVMQDVAFPVYSRSESLDDMRRLRVRIVRVHAVVILPLLALLAAVAPVAIPFLYGDRWEPAVLPTQILCAMGAVYPISAGLGALLLAAGLPRTLALANVAQLAAYVGAMLWASRWGVAGICVASVVVASGTALLMHYFVLDRRLGIPIGQVWTDIRPAVVSSLVLLAAAWPIVTIASGAGVPAAVVLLLASAAGAAGYLGALRAGFPIAWGDLTMVLDAVLPDRLRPVSRPGRAAQGGAAA